MKLAQALLLTAAAVGTLTACSYYYFASADFSPPAIELDADNTLRSYKITVCYEGGGDPTVDLRLDAHVSGDAASEVIASSEDAAGRTLSSDRDEPTGVHFDSRSVDEACSEGWLVDFALASDATDPARVEWTVFGEAWSDTEEEVDDGRVTIDIEAL